MYKYLKIILCCLLLAPFAHASSENFRTPAEFEVQDSLWVGWPTYDYIVGYSTDDAVLNMLEALTPHVKVNLVVQSQSAKQQAAAKISQRNINTENLHYKIYPVAEFWLRDMGPVFMTGDQGSKQMVDFNFNTWGVYNDSNPYALVEEKIDRLIADDLGYNNIVTRLTGEGGNREFNGQGTLMLVEAVEMQRNPNRSRAVLEQEYKRLFNVSKIIWLKQGLVEDPIANTVIPGPNGEAAYSFGTGGHIDEIARFVNANTILLAEITAAEAASSELLAENRRRMEKNFQILKQARDQNGHAFTIIRIPAADVEYVTIDERDPIYWFLDDLVFGDNSEKGLPPGPAHYAPASSYLNFVITNNVVLAASYWQQGKPESTRLKDLRVVAALQQAFPNRAVVAANPIAINMGGGGMHCISAHEPSVF
ncbi:agmatine deiminase family protein [Dasania marina]|uniref:agmatine deiminase family protein n=1 Tax=Dasania marina TaxID=471499 RepID=UPI0030DCD517|tara:strand:+ start:90461 stop:91726 length:1266 start_codon:yes stop_codon:yes gene_type:complete